MDKLQFLVLIYDKTHKVRAPAWRVGDRVLLREDSVKSGSPKVITRKRYIGPFLNKEVVKGKPNIGIAYQLISEDSGKLVRNLVTNDRIKAYNIDREKFTRRLPRLSPRQDKSDNTYESAKEKTSEPKLSEYVEETKVKTNRKKPGE